MQVRQLAAVAPCFAVLAVSVPPAEASDKVDKKAVAFFRAVKEGNLAGIREAVKKKVNLELVGLLLKAGAAVDIRDLKSGYTPLMCAALGGHDDVVKAPLQAGADATLTSNSGETARQLAELSQHPATAELLKPRPTPAPRKPAARAPRTKPTPKPTPRP